MTDFSIAAPLNGLTIVEYGDDLAAAYCAKNFADLGATAYLAEAAHLASESAALRAYVDNGKRPLAELTGVVDVALLPARTIGPPAPVTVYISDFGETGPQAHWRTSELVTQASSGLMSLIGDPAKAPLPLGGHQMDYTTGWMAFTGAQIALTAKDLGNGPAEQEVHVSRLEAAAYIEWKGRAYAQAGNHLERGERSGPVVIRCTDGYFGFYYRAADWERVLTVFDDERLRSAPFDDHRSRITHAPELIALLESIVADNTADQLYRALQRVGVPAGPVLTAERLSAVPQYEAREFFVPIQVDGTEAAAPATPVTFNGIRPEARQR